MTVLIREQCAVLSVLHDHVYLIVLFDGVPQLDYVRVVDGRVQVDFSLEHQQLLLSKLVRQLDLNGERSTIFTA